MLMFQNIQKYVDCWCCHSQIKFQYTTLIYNLLYNTFVHLINNKDNIQNNNISSKAMRKINSYKQFSKIKSNRTERSWVDLIGLSLVRLFIIWLCMCNRIFAMIYENFIQMIIIFICFHVFVIDIDTRNKHYWIWINLLIFCSLLIILSNNFTLNFF